MNGSAGLPRGLGMDPAPDPGVGGSGFSGEIMSPMAQIEEALRASLDAYMFEGQLGPAIRHAALGGGKRIRPLLCWHACVACGGVGEDALTACVAIELVHAFSLVHDDLPAMDDDELRRGKPTVHVAFGEALAILTGDALHSLAHEVLARSSLDLAIRDGCSAALARATREMINGQVLDIQSEHQGLSLGGVRAIHAAKTGALIRSACEMGGLCAHADGPSLESLRGFGMALGLVFQATDDLIDAEQASEHAGKRTGKDLDAGRPSLAGVLGIVGARREIARLVGECEASLAAFGGAGGSLREILAAIAERTR